MRKPALFLIALLFASSAVVAQSNDKGKFKIYDLQFNSGIYAPRISFTQAEMRLLAPASDLLNADFTGYGYSCCHFYNDNRWFSVQLGFNKPDRGEAVFKPKFNVGISYLNQRIDGPGRYKHVVVPVDTLYSPATGLRFFVDSIHNYNLYSFYESEYLMVHLGVSVETDDNRRFSFYGGANLAAGVSLESKTNVDYVYHNSIRSSNNVDYSNWYFFPHTGGGHSNYVSEAFRNKTSGLLQAQMPIGMQFRLAKHTDLLKDTYIMVEYKPALTLYMIPEVGNWFKFGRMYSIGLKVRLGSR